MIGKHSEFEDRVRALVDGELDAEEERQLADQLLADEAALNFYVQYVTVHALLKWKCVESLDEPQLPPVVDNQVEVAESCEQTLPPRPLSLLQRASLRPVSPSLAVAFAGTIVVLFGLAFMPLRNFLDRDDPSHRESPGITIAKLSAEQKVQWVSGKGALQKSGRIWVGQVLEIAAGLVEIQYDSGTRVILEGPAEFKVGHVSPEAIGNKASLNSGSLYRGKLVAKVEGRDAKGFFIDTPNGLRVEDLGTVFGVSVSDRGVAKAFCMKGKVKLSVTQSSADPLYLTAGMAGHIVAGQPVSLGSNAAIANSSQEFLAAEQWMRTQIAYRPRNSISSDSYSWGKFSTGVGHVFRVKAPLIVNQLGTIANSTAPHTGFKGYTVQMFRLNSPQRDASDATLLGTAAIRVGQAAVLSNFGPGGKGNLYFSQLDTPIQLVQGETYVVAAFGFMKDREYLNFSSAMQALPIPYKALSLAQPIEHITSRFGMGGVGHVPDQGDRNASDTGNYGGPTFRFYEARSTSHTSDQKGE